MLTLHRARSLLLSERTRKALADPARYLIREVDMVTVAGLEPPVRLHGVFEADLPHLREQKRTTREPIARGLVLYR